MLPPAVCSATIIPSSASRCQPSPCACCPLQYPTISSSTVRVWPVIVGTGSPTHLPEHSTQYLTHTSSLVKSPSTSENVSSTAYLAGLPHSLSSGGTLFCPIMASQVAMLTSILPLLP